MARPVKCRWCNELESDREKVIKIENKGFYHIDRCYDEHLKETEFKRKEVESRECLIQLIVQIHKLQSVQDIPSSFYPFIEELRNDTKLFGKLKKNYKKGIKYEALEYTYDFCKDKISWAKSNKEFKNILSELKYGLAIVRNNIADARAHFNKSKNSQVQSQQIKKNADELLVINKKIKEEQKKSISQGKVQGVDLSALFD